jgi:exodeoxyribonuclease-3
MTLRLLSYNIRYGGVGREAALARTVQYAAPDVVVLQEATHPGVVERMARMTGMAHWGSTPGHSVGFMSRAPVRRHAWHRSPASRRAFLEIELDSGLRIFGVHLSATHSNWSEGRRAGELRTLLATIEQHANGAHVIAGDFNTLAPGEKLELRRLPRRLRLLAWIGGRTIQWRTIQIVLDAGYRDGYRRFHSSEHGYTFPARDPHVRLDYVFVPAFAEQKLLSCEILDGGEARVASDHLPLLAELDA